VDAYLVMPGLLVVVDNSSSKTPSRVDASSCDWDGGQVNHEHSKSNWERSQYLLIKNKTQIR